MNLPANKVPQPASTTSPQNTSSHSSADQQFSGQRESASADYASIAPKQLSPKHIVQLQRTIGNRATINQIAPKSIQRVFTWDAGAPAWKNATQMDASGASEGVTGVIFMQDAQGAKIILKPAKEGARSVVATTVMQSAGAATAKTRSILLNSTEAKFLLGTMDRLIEQNAATPSAQTKRKALSDGTFDSLVIMEAMPNMTDFAKLATGGLPGGDYDQLFTQMWKPLGFWTQLGRVHAADMIMGNPDRLDRMNMKNIFVNFKTGGAIGIDLDLETASVGAIAGNAYQTKNGAMSASLSGNEYKDWVTYAIEGDTGKKQFLNKGGEEKTQPIGTRSGELGGADVRKADESKLGAIINQIRKDMHTDLLFTQDAKQGPTPEQINRAASWNNQDWNLALTEFKRGVTLGMKRLQSAQDTGKFDVAKNQSDDRTGSYSEIEPKVIKIRLMYYEQKKLHPNWSDNMLRTLLVSYAEWLHAGQGINPFANAQNNGPAPMRPQLIPGQRPAVGPNVT